MKNMINCSRKKTIGSLTYRTRMTALDGATFGPLPHEAEAEVERGVELTVATVDGDEILERDRDGAA